MGWERGAGPLSPVAQAASSHLPAAGSNCLLALLLSHVLSFLLESYWIAAPQSQGASCCGAHWLLLKAMGKRSLQSVGETCLIPGAFWRSSSPSHCRIGGELVGVFLKISTLCVLCQVNSFILTVCCCTPWSEPSIDFFQWLFNVFVPFFFFPEQQHRRCCIWQKNKVSLFKACTLQRQLGQTRLRSSTSISKANWTKSVKAQNPKLQKKNPKTPHLYLVSRGLCQVQLFIFLLGISLQKPENSISSSLDLSPLDWPSSPHPFGYAAQSSARVYPPLDVMLATASAQGQPQAGLGVMQDWFRSSHKK